MSPWEMAAENWNLDNSPTYLAFDIMTRIFSPYQLNPMNINPLRDILTSIVDFDKICECEEIKLFISATRVRDGQVEVFNRKRLSPDMIMTSACIPFLYQAVRVEGEDYWDCGYMGNPVLFPFTHRCSCNAICPGYVKTPLVENQLADSAKSRGISEEEVVRDVMLAAQRTKQFTAIEDIGAMAVYLCAGIKGVSNRLGGQSQTLGQPLLIFSRVMAPSGQAVLQMGQCMHKGLSMTTHSSSIRGRLNQQASTQVPQAWQACSSMTRSKSRCWSNLLFLVTPPMPKFLIAPPNPDRPYPLKWETTIMASA
ncbi:MAG: hypothetical protein U5L00_03210 [Desulfovermiculus sp.]|nr:hypothetical protein [Desulfovermiculus sp.]